MICCLFSGDTYLFLWVVISTSSSLSRDSFVDVLFETLVILSAILLPIKSPVASFWRSFYCIYCRFFLALSRSFWRYFLLKFLPRFLAEDKNPYPFTYIRSRGSAEYLILIHYLHLITIIKFILSSIFNGYCFDQWTILQFCYIHSWMFLGIYDL